MATGSDGFTKVAALLCTTDRTRLNPTLATEEVKMVQCTGSRPPVQRHQGSSDTKVCVYMCMYNCFWQLLLLIFRQLEQYLQVTTAICAT